MMIETVYNHLFEFASGSLLMMKIKLNSRSHLQIQYFKKVYFDTIKVKDD